MKQAEGTETAACQSLGSTGVMEAAPHATEHAIAAFCSARRTIVQFVLPRCQCTLFLAVCRLVVKQAHVLVPQNVVHLQVFNLATGVQDPAVFAPMHTQVQLACWMSGHLLYMQEYSAYPALPSDARFTCAFLLTSIPANGCLLVMCRHPPASYHAWQPTPDSLCLARLWVEALDLDQVPQAVIWPEKLHATKCNTLNLRQEPHHHVDKCTTLKTHMQDACMTCASMQDPNAPVYAMPCPPQLACFGAQG